MCAAFANSALGGKTRCSSRRDSMLVSAILPLTKEARSQNILSRFWLLASDFWLLFLSNVTSTSRNVRNSAECSSAIVPERCLRGRWQSPGRPARTHHSRCILPDGYRASSLLRILVHLSSDGCNPPDRR